MSYGKNVVPGDDEVSKNTSPKCRTNKGRGPANKAKRQKAGDEVTKKAMKPDDINKVILSFMKNIHTTLKKQDDRLNKVCENMQNMDELRL